MKLTEQEKIYRQTSLSQPWRVIANQLTTEELQFAHEIVHWRGGTYVGAWEECLPGIDGFYYGYSVQQKISESQLYSTIICHIKEAARNIKRAKRIGSVIFLHAKALDRQRIIYPLISNRIPSLTYGKLIKSIHILTHDKRWIDIEAGHLCEEKVWR